MLTKLDRLTFDFILAVIITDCIVGFFVWHEVLYNTGDTGLETAIGIGAGIAISLAVTIVIFAHWELIRMISERYKRLRFEAGLKQGLEEGKKLGREEGRKEGRKDAERRFEEYLGRVGIELSKDERERLFGATKDTDGQ